MIFIWRGRGILLVLFVVLGALGGLFAGQKMAVFTGAERSIVSMGFVEWGAAIGAWIFALGIGKTLQRSFLDPATRQWVTVRKSHSLFFIPPVAWSIGLTLLALVATPTLLISILKPQEMATIAKTSGAAGFNEANKLLNSFSGQYGFGNSPRAEELARLFAETAQVKRQHDVESGKSSAVPLARNHFLVYCRLQDGQCAYLVHIKDLRKLTTEAKEWMGETCWAAARSVTEKMDPKPLKLAVGLRGALLYDRVLLGSGASDGENHSGGVQQTLAGSDSREALYSFFTQSERESVVEPTPLISAAEALRMAQTAISAQDAPLGSGNTQVGRDLALKFTTMVEGSLQQVVVKKTSDVLDKPRFLMPTYCQLGEDSLAMVVEIPSYDAYPPEIQRVVKSRVWQFTQSWAACLDPQPRKLAAAIRCGDHFDSLQTGVADGPLDLNHLPVPETTLSSNDVAPALQAYFETMKKTNFRLTRDLSLHTLDSAPPKSDASLGSTPHH